MVNEFKPFELVKVDLSVKEHQCALLHLMNDYMLDDMGLNTSLSEELGHRIIKGLSVQSNYLGFLLKDANQYLGLANCFVGFSTFKAQPLINIHDFIISPHCRRKGAGKALLNLISQYGSQYNYCKITLEVRYDNVKAQNLYKKIGFKECNPPMHFWQKEIQN